MYAGVGAMAGAAARHPAVLVGLFLHSYAGQLSEVREAIERLRPALAELRREE
jgi:hypothetical protein